MLSRHIGPRGRTVLVCELVTLGLLVTLGFGLEAVSPGWWGITKDAFSRLTEPGDLAEGGEPAACIYIDPHTHVILSGAEPPAADEGEPFAEFTIYQLTSPDVLRQVLSSPRVARLELIAGLPEKGRIAAFKPMIGVKRTGQIVQLTCRRGTREEKVLLLNSLVEAFRDMVIDRAKIERQTGLDRLSAHFDDLARHHHELRKREAALAVRREDSPEAAEIAAISRMLNRLGDEILVRKLNQDAPERIQILHNAQ